MGGSGAFSTPKPAACVLLPELCVLQVVGGWAGALLFLQTSTTLMMTWSIKIVCMPNWGEGGRGGCLPLHMPATVPLPPCLPLPTGNRETGGGQMEYAMCLSSS